jgi:hypothetical protein
MAITWTTTKSKAIPMILYMLFFKFSQKTGMNGVVYKRLGRIYSNSPKTYYLFRRFRTMGLVKYALMAGGLFFLIFGFIYILASGLGPRYAAIGIGLTALGLLLIFISYKLEKVKMSQPRLIEQNISVGVSGDVSMERLKCKGCGNTLGEKDLRMVDGAVVMSCPYCGGVYQLQEEPKW